MSLHRLCTLAVSITPGCCISVKRLSESEKVSWYEKSKNDQGKVTGKINPIYAMILGPLAIAV